MASCVRNPYQQQCVNRCETNPDREFCPALCTANPDYRFCTTTPDPLTPEEQQLADDLYLSFGQGFGIATLFCVAGFALAALLNLIKR